jgi:hypothetical protein
VFGPGIFNSPKLLVHQQGYVVHEGITYRRQLLNAEAASAQTAASNDVDKSNPFRRANMCSIVTGEHLTCFKEAGTSLETLVLTFAKRSESDPFHLAPLKVCQKWRPAIHESTHERDTLEAPVAANAANKPSEAGILRRSGTFIVSQN